jgi:hypothetical protein
MSDEKPFCLRKNWCGSQFRGENFVIRFFCCKLLLPVAFSTVRKWAFIITFFFAATFEFLTSLFFSGILRRITGTKKEIIAPFSIL